MNYYEAYKRFISKAKKENIHSGYTSISKMHASKNGNEIHHIKPKCLGGADAFDNFVLLSHDDHIYAHWLLGFSFYKNGNFKTLKTLSCNKFSSSTYFKRNAFRRLKIQISLANNPCKCLGIFTLKQASMYVAAIRPYSIKNNKDMANAMFKALSLAMLRGVYGNFKFKLKLSAS